MGQLRCIAKEAKYSFPLVSFVKWSICLEGLIPFIDQ